MKRPRDGASELDAQMSRRARVVSTWARSMIARIARTTPAEEAPPSPTLLAEGTTPTQEHFEEVRKERNRETAMMARSCPVYKGALADIEDGCLDAFENGRPPPDLTEARQVVEYGVRGAD